MKTIQNYQNTPITNTASLTFPLTASTDERMDISHRISRRLMQTVSALPDKLFVGMQFDFTGDAAHTTVFSCNNLDLTAEDYHWLFEDASCESGEPEEDCFFGEDRFVYSLLMKPHAQRRFDDDLHEAMHECYPLRLSSMMYQAQGLLRLIVDSIGNTTLLISLPKQLSIPMRTTLSEIFPYTVAIEINHLAGAEKARYKPLCTECFRDTLRALIMSCIPEDSSDRTSAEEHPPAQSSAADEADQEGNKDNRTPLSEMSLSVRTYNCLTRAGYRYAEDLFDLTDSDYARVRNFSTKWIEEVKQKLLEMFPDKVNFDPKEPIDYLAQLEELVGLEDIKAEILKIAAFARMKHAMAQRGNTAVPLVLNMVFAGNPGTAKTTVARILAGIFYQIGLLKSESVVEVGRSDLVGQYCGHTADKVKTVFAQAKGKLLFIDEAYALNDHRKGGFGDEAINTIVQEMENNREDTIVIFAGYPDEMDAFFERNPGLRSRVPFHVAFRNYTADEMVQIAKREVALRGFTIAESACNTLHTICKQEALTPTSGNGRFCRNLAEKAILNYASRVYGNNSDTTPDTDFVLTAEDFGNPSQAAAPAQPRRIGFAA